MHRILSKRFKGLLPLGFAMIIAMMILTSLVAASQIKQGADSMLSAIQQHSKNNKQLRNMSHAESSRSTILVSMIQTQDPFLLDELYFDLNAQTTKFNAAREILMMQEMDDNLKEMLEQQRKLSQIYEPMLNEVYSLLVEGKKVPATLLLTQQTLPRQKAVLDLFKDMADFQYNVESEANTKSKSDNHKVLTNVIIFDIVSVFISIILTRFILRRQREQDKELAYLATTDILTELPNRTNLISNISLHIKKKPVKPFAVIFFDIDYFKSINDNYGHEVGDELLRQFANKINWFIKPQDVLSRFGGDEFVLLLRSIKSEQEAVDLVNKLSNELDTSITINENEIFMSASIGASLYPLDGKDAKTLLTNADIAMYSAKELGRNCFQFFSKETSDQLEREHAMCHALHSVLKNQNKDNQLCLQYQPLLNIKTGDTTECEALLRWKNHNGESIAADEFIPLAEKTNLIEKLNLFVIDEACKQQSLWQNTRNNGMRININLSGNKIIFPKLLKRFIDNVEFYNLDPKLFGIELTERTIHEVSKGTIKHLEKMREKGVKISIDDFGTGYSSLSYLKKLPITTLKIDKEFIVGLPDDRADHALVKAIITLGHSLNLDVVAEGVETYEQFVFLKKYSCDIAQGYYYHRPLPGNKISHLQLAA
ncbi:EAL domain-containing protein [uncultured Cocleimonas sp.]|uniref:EAL domain-containing protein n=1 Tax=uncultured Cocleimonas sp. TaxID=1051587 RepID=UPI00260A75AF|nr:EAL domain-containing protein [uncultured Cocleimonas sp.]